MMSFKLAQNITIFQKQNNKTKKMFPQNPWGTD